MTPFPRIAHLFIKRERSQPMQAVETIEMIAGRGILGDAAFDQATRQVLLVNAEVVEHLDLSPGMLRENIVVGGLQIDDQPVGTLLRIGNAQLEITGRCDPCWKMDRIRAGLQSILEGQRGMLAVVLESGQIQVGDPIEILPPVAHHSETARPDSML